MTVGGNRSLLFSIFTLYRLGSSCTFQLLTAVGTGWKAHPSYLRLNKTTLDSLSSIGSWLGVGAIGSSQGSWLASMSLSTSKSTLDLLPQGAPSFYREKQSRWQTDLK